MAVLFYSVSARTFWKDKGSPFVRGAALNFGNISVISNQIIRWGDVLVLIVVNGVSFAPFILGKEYRGDKAGNRVN